jgi:hypothetical protein
MHEHHNEDEPFDDGKRNYAVHQFFIGAWVTSRKLIYVYNDGDYDDYDKDSNRYDVLIATVATNPLRENLTIIFIPRCEMHMELTFTPPASDTGQVHLLSLSQAAPNDPSNIKQKTSLMISRVTFTRTHQRILTLIAYAATSH